MPEPETGELYAVYFGTAFHLGVYIGQGEVVHYLNDNYVYRVTWEKFLDGRTPEHWTYPDLDPVPADAVVRTALSEVGKTYPYNLAQVQLRKLRDFLQIGRHDVFLEIRADRGGSVGGCDASAPGHGGRAEHAVLRMAGVSFRRPGGEASFRFRSGGWARP